MCENLMGEQRVARPSWWVRGGGATGGQQQRCKGGEGRKRWAGGQETVLRGSHALCRDQCVRFPRQEGATCRELLRGFWEEVQKRVPRRGRWQCLQLVGRAAAYGDMVEAAGHSVGASGAGQVRADSTNGSRRPPIQGCCCTAAAGLGVWLAAWEPSWLHGNRYAAGTGGTADLSGGTVFGWEGPAKRAA